MSTPIETLPAPVQPPPAGGGVVAVRVIGSALAVLLVAGATFGVVTQFFRQTATETQVYPSVSAVSVSATTGSVTVRAGAPGSPVTLTRHLGWSFRRPRSSETVTGGRLEVQAECPSEITSGLCSIGYDLVVPPDLPLTLGTHTGTIEVDSVTGDVSATTHTGSIELNGVRSRRVEAQTSTGPVDLHFAAPPDVVRAETSTGSVDIAVPGGPTTYAVTASTSTGSTDVSVPVDPASPHRISAHTSTGSVDVHVEP